MPIYRENRARAGEPAGVVVASALAKAGRGMTSVWQKACACNGPSTVGRLVLTQRYDDEKQALFAKLTEHPGPVCDVCHTPWVRTLITE